MKLYVAGTDGCVYVSPRKDNMCISTLCRCLPDVRVGVVQVFNMFNGNGVLYGHRVLDYRAYVDAGMSKEEIMRMEKLIGATARMVFDQNESNSENAWNIAEAIRGVLEQEGFV